MVKGVSVKFKSYEDTVPRFLKFVKFGDTLKDKSTIVLKPSLKHSSGHNTSAAFVDEVLKFVMANKDVSSKVFLAEGSDGEDTLEVFDSSGYRQLAEKYGVSLIDLNTSEVEEVHDRDFLKFEKIFYPKILLESFVIALPRLTEDAESEMQGSLSTMIGAYPASHYKGLFSTKKSKLHKWPLKYSIHDIIRCKMPEVAIIDASDYGLLLAGKPLELDKQAAQVMGKDWKSIQHIRLIDESFAKSEKESSERAASKAEREGQVPPTTLSNSSKS